MNECLCRIPEKGIFLRELKKLFIYGTKDFLYSLSNILTAVMVSVIADSFALKFYTMGRVKIERDFLSSQEFWDTVNNLKENDTAGQQSVYETFYWLNEGI